NSLPYSFSFQSACWPESQLLHNIIEPFACQLIFCFFLPIAFLTAANTRRQAFKAKKPHKAVFALVYL
ncbi:MAG: hypothetical protein FWG30_05480, partial [Eubacteriaceae bacterium]|nr:hypothetical protein [Eubacteriaceae bacterium]